MDPLGRLKRPRVTPKFDENASPSQDEIQQEIISNAQEDRLAVASISTHIQGECEEACYPSISETLSPVSSSTPTMEEDNSTVIQSENALRVGTRVLASKDGLRYHNGVIYRIDNDGICVAFDMGNLKRFPLDCKYKIVIDRKAHSSELMIDAPVLVRLARNKAMYRGRILSSGTTRGFCILLNDPFKEKVWKRAKSLRVMTDVVVEGDSKPSHESRVDTPCTNEETNVDTSLLNEDNNAFSNQTTLQEEVSDNCLYKKQKICNSGLPTMVHYSQPPVLRYSKGMTVDQRVTSEMQSENEIVQQFSGICSPVSGFQSRVLADTRSNFTDFDSNVPWSDPIEHQYYSEDSPSTSFQSTVPYLNLRSTELPRSNHPSIPSDFSGSRSNIASFQSSGVAPQSNVTDYECAIPNFNFDETTFQSSFVRDNRNCVPSNMERRSMDHNVGSIHNPIMNAFITQPNSQTALMPFYIGGKTSDGTAVYYALPYNFATSASFTVAPTDYQLFMPIERESSEDTNPCCAYDDSRTVPWPNNPAMVSTEEKGVEGNSGYWPSEERSSCSYQDYDFQGTCTPEQSTPSSICTNNPESNQSSTTVTNESHVGPAIKEEQRSSCRFMSPSQANTLPIYHTHYYSQGDATEAGLIACDQIPLQSSMFSTNGITPAYTIPPAGHATDPTTPQQLTPTNLTAYTPTLNPPTYSSMPLIARVEGSGIFKNLSQTEESLNSFATAVRPGQNDIQGKASKCSDLVVEPLSREERRKIILSAFGFTNFENAASTPPKESKKGQGVHDLPCSVSSSTIRENSSGCTARTDLDEGDALSPSVIKAATILTNSKLQRWKTARNLMSSSKRSLNNALRDPSTSRKKKTSGLYNTDKGRREHSVCRKFAKGKIGSVVSSCGSMFQESADERKEEFIVCKSSNTHRTVSIQVQSKGAKPLKRIGVHRNSTGSQTDDQVTSHDSTLNDESYTSAENVAENNSSLALASDSNDCNHPSLKSATTDVKVSCIELDTGHVQYTQCTSDEKTCTDITIEAFSQPATTPPIRKDFLREDHINLRCHEVINEEYVERTQPMSPIQNKKSKMKMTVQLQGTKQPLKIKFVEDSTIVLFSQEQPLKFLTCF